MIVNWNYLVGYFVSDGSFSVTLSQGVLKFYFKISSQTNTNTLELFNQFFSKLNINFERDDTSNSESDRAPARRVQGANQVLAVINGILNNANVLSGGGYSASIVGTKYRTLLIVKYIIENRETLLKRPAVLIDLIKNLHKGTPLEEERLVKYLESEGEKNPSQNTELKLGGEHQFSRLELEKQYNVPEGASIEAANSILMKIDQQVDQQVEWILTHLSSNTLKVDLSFIVGLTDGDGCFYAGPVPDKTGKKGYSGNYYLSLRITLTMDLRSKLILKIWLYGLGVSPDIVLSNKPKVIYKHRTTDPTKTRKSLYALIHSDKRLFVSIKHFEKMPPIGDAKKSDFELLSEILRVKEQKLLTLEKKDEFKHKIEERRKQKKLLKEQKKMLKKNAKENTKK